MVKGVVTVKIMTVNNGHDFVLRFTLKISWHFRYLFISLRFES